MCTSVRPDFNAEEVASVTKNQELDMIVEDMADHLPIEDPTKALSGLTHADPDRRRWTGRDSKRKKCSSRSFVQWQCCFNKI